jgi:hypothetical protein
VAVQERLHGAAAKGVGRDGQPEDAVPLVRVFTPHCFCSSNKWFAASFCLSQGQGGRGAAASRECFGGVGGDT